MTEHVHQVPLATDHHHGEIVRAPLDEYLYDGLDERGLLRLVNVAMVADHAPLPKHVHSGEPDQGITGTPLLRTRQLTGEPHPETGDTDSGALGVDMLYVPPGSSFPPHVHPGHHLLMCIRGQGSVTYGDEEIAVRPGDLYMILGGIAHAVGSDPSGEGHWLLAFGAPHKRVDSHDRMRLLEVAETLGEGHDPGTMAAVEKHLRDVHDQ
jgi:quercetin dioxygenase-like cupin family protein